MARLKYQPSTRATALNVPQLSRAGITNLRRESERVITGLEKNQRAVEKQQEIDRQALIENAALKEKRLVRDRKTEVENLQKEKQALIDQAKADQDQFRIDTEARNLVFDSIASFSKTAKKRSAENTAAMMRDQTKAANAVNISLMKDKDIIAGNKIQSLFGRAGIIELDDSIEDAVEFGESKLDLSESFLRNHGLGAYGKKVLINRMVQESFPLLINKAIESTEQIYDRGDGTLFSGAEARRNPDLMEIVVDKVEADIINNVGIANPAYLVSSRTEIQKLKGTLINEASGLKLKDNNEVLESNAKALEMDKTLEGYTLAFAARRRTLGPDAAHRGWEAAAENPDNPIEVLGNIIVSEDGKTYKEYRPDSYEKFSAKRRKNYVQRIKDEDAFARAKEREYVLDTIDHHRQAAEENPEMWMEFINDRYHSKSLNVPPLLKEIERVALNRYKKEEENKLNDKILGSSLDAAYVNTIKNPSVRKKGLAALERQEVRLFGAPKAQVIKGYTALAQDVLNLEIGPDTKDSWRVVQMVNEMVKHHKERYAVNQDLNTTINSIRQDRVDAAAGKKNFLSRKDIGGGRTQYEHEKSDEEQAQTNLRIDKKMLTYGAEVASQAFALASGPEMDATVLSAQAGNLSFPKGIYRVADKFGLKPTEVFNEQQKARMLVTGEKFQLIKPSIGQKVIDDVLTPSMRILLKKTEEFDNNSMRKRVTAQATAGMDNGQMLRNSTRRSMPGSNSLQALRNFAPQVSSVTFDTGQPGIDIFFEDHNFPAVLPGAVKDIGYQVNADGSGYGHYLVIESIDSETGEVVDVLYGHLPVKPTQSIGQSIELGEIIGKQGGTGSVQSYDGTIASIDFLAPAPRGSGSMTPYSNYESLRERIASQFQ